MGRTLRFVTLAATFTTFVIFQSGCQTTTEAWVARPAEINMVGYERVVVGKIDGEGGNVMRARLIQELHQQGRFEVLDRDNLDARSREQDLKDLGISGGESSSRVAAADILISGSVMQHGCETSVGQGKRFVNGVWVPGYFTKGKATVEVAFTVTDLDRMSTVTSTSVPVQSTGETGVFSSPPNLNPSTLYAECYEGVVRRFVAKMSGTQERVELDMKSVKVAPSTDVGIAMFKANDYAAAKQAFESAVQEAQSAPKAKPDDIARTHYHLGVVQEWLGEYDEAMASYKRAISTNPNKESFAVAMNRCRMRIADIQRFEDQGLNAPGRSGGGN